MGYEEIAYDVEDGLLTVTLDRPDHLNAFTVTMLHELLDAFDRADADDDVRAIVVTGRGRAFAPSTGDHLLATAVGSSPSASSIRQSP